MIERFLGKNGAIIVLMSAIVGFIALVVVTWISASRPLVIETPTMRLVSSQSSALLPLYCVEVSWHITDSDTVLLNKIPVEAQGQTVVCNPNSQQITFSATLSDGTTRTQWLDLPILINNPLFVGAIALLAGALAWAFAQLTAGQWAWLGEARFIVPVLIIALLITVMGVFFVPTAPTFDGFFYLQEAKEIAEGGGISAQSALQGVGYPLSLAINYRLAQFFGVETLIMVKLTQGLANVLISLLLYRMAYYLGGRAVGYIAGIGYALYIPSVLYAGTLHSELYGTFWLVLGWFLWIKAFNSDAIGWRWAWLGGVCLSWASLTRVSLLPIVLASVVIVSVVWGTRTRSLKTWGAFGVLVLMTFSLQLLWAVFGRVFLSPEALERSTQSFLLFSLVNILNPIYLGWATDYKEAVRWWTFPTTNWLEVIANSFNFATYHLLYSDWLIGWKPSFILTPEGANVLNRVLFFGILVTLPLTITAKRAFFALAGLCGAFFVSFLIVWTEVRHSIPMMPFVFVMFALAWSTMRAYRGWFAGIVGVGLAWALLFEVNVSALITMPFVVGLVPLIDALIWIVPLITALGVTYRVLHRLTIVQNIAVTATVTLLGVFLWAYLYVGAELRSSRFWHEITPNSSIEQAFILPENSLDAPIKRVSLLISLDLPHRSTYTPQAQQALVAIQDAPPASYSLSPTFCSFPDPTSFSWVCDYYEWTAEYRATHPDFLPQWWEVVLPPDQLTEEAFSIQFSTASFARISGIVEGATHDISPSSDYLGADTSIYKFIIHEDWRLPRPRFSHTALDTRLNGALLINGQRTPIYGNWGIRLRVEYADGRVIFY